MCLRECSRRQPPGRKFSARCHCFWKEGRPGSIVICKGDSAFRFPGECSEGRCKGDCRHNEQDRRRTGRPYTREAWFCPEHVCRGVQGWEKTGGRGKGESQSG